MRLSVLDQSPVRADAGPADAIADTVVLAQLCDRLGYHRYWLAEHHASDGLASTCPEILIGRIAAATERLRVGAGGVMLSHYSALKVAEQFRMLETLFPGRIDLGIGRAPGGDGRSSRALRNGPGLPIDAFPRQIDELIGFLHDTLPSDHPYAGVTAMPVPDAAAAPPLWLLGSSDQSAAFAAHFGCRFCFAQFIEPRPGVGNRVASLYREHFRPSARLAVPQAAVAVSVICADTEARAATLRKSRDLWLLKLSKGEIGPVVSPAAADVYPYSAADRAMIDTNRERTVSGDPEQVKTALLALAEYYGVDEIIVLTSCYDPNERRHSYELLADAFALPSKP